MLAPWKKSYEKPRQHIKKQRYYFIDNGLSSQSYGFSSIHVWMWEVTSHSRAQLFANPWTVVYKAPLCPWNFPGKSTGVGCHVLLQFMKVKVKVKSFNRVRLLATPWTAAHQASLSITNSRNLLKLMSIVLVIPSNHLILCHPLLLLPLIFPSIRVFSNESVLCIRWPEY